MSEIEQSTAEEARSRVQRIRDGFVDVASWAAAVVTAFAKRDWVSLGYESWEVYTDAEYGDLREQLPPVLRPQIAAAMRAESMDLRSIGAAIGVGKSTVADDLKKVDALSGSRTTHKQISMSGGRVYERAAPARPEPGPEPEAATDQPARPLVLVAPAVPGAEPAEAELWDDNPGKSTVKVVYTASRTGAWVARKRILGPTGGEPEPTGPACEKCRGPIAADEATNGFVRCEGCDPDGEHFADDDGQCKRCRPRRDAPPESPSPMVDVPLPADDIPQEAPGPAPWTAEELALRARLEAGDTVVVSLRAHHARLTAWAQERQLFVRIDRRTEWGNPFEMGPDGTRHEVIAAYADHYLPHKPSLLGKLAELQGKALACWCAPEPCHGDVLAQARTG